MRCLIEYQLIGFIFYTLRMYCELVLWRLFLTGAFSFPGLLYNDTSNLFFYSAMLQSKVACKRNDLISTGFFSFLFALCIPCVSFRLGGWHRKVHFISATAETKCLTCFDFNSPLDCGAWWTPKYIEQVLARNPQELNWKSSVCFTDEGKKGEKSSREPALFHTQISLNSRSFSRLLAGSHKKANCLKAF